MKKALIWIGSILIVIGVLITLTFTVFTIKNAEVVFHNNSVSFSEKQEDNKVSYEEIISSAEINFGHTVFFDNKQNYIDKLEKKYPKLKIVNIEVVFPNKLVFHCTEREGVFAVTYSEGFYVCDQDLKVLEVVNDTFVSTQENYIQLFAFSLIPNTYSAGDFLDLPEIDVAKKISEAFYLTNRNIYAQMALVQEIKIVHLVDSNRPLNEQCFGLEITDFAGLKTQIVSADRFLPEKINLFCAYQTSVDPSKKYLYIFENSNGKIEVYEKNLEN